MVLSLAEGWASGGRGSGHVRCLRDKPARISGFKVAHPVRGATPVTTEEAMRRILRKKKVEPSGEADAVAKRIVRRRIRASVTRADAALTHTYASGLPRAAAP